MMVLCIIQDKIGQENKLLYENLYKYDGSVSTVVDAKERSIQSFDFVDGKLVLIASTHEKYGLNENPKFFDQDFNLIALIGKNVLETV